MVRTSTYYYILKAKYVTYPGYVCFEVYISWVRLRRHRQTLWKKYETCIFHEDIKQYLCSATTEVVDDDLQCGAIDVNPKNFVLQLPILIYAIRIALQYTRKIEQYCNNVTVVAYMNKKCIVFYSSVI